MQINKMILILVSAIYLTTSTAEPSYDVMKSCQKGVANQSSITMANLNSGSGYSHKPIQGCEDQFEITVKDRTVGSYECKDELYIFSGQKKIKASDAQDMTHDPSVMPGDFYPDVSTWTKITEGPNSYICINSPLSQSGGNAALNMYYIVEGVFDDRAPLRAYFYYFGDRK